LYLHSFPTRRSSDLSPENLAKELRLPDGWRLAAHDALEEPRAVGDVFTYALLLWPAVVGLLVLGSEGWQLALRIALAVWLGLLRSEEHTSELQSLNN